MKSILAVAATAVAATVSLAACGAAGPGNSSPSRTGSNLVNGATFTYATSTDLGTLDPYLSPMNATSTFDSFLYGRLISLDAQGNAQPQLAQTWSTASTTKATFTLRPGITCSDGTPLKAGDVAADINFLAKPANKSPLLGQSVQPGTTATADDAAGTITVTSGKPEPFLVEALGSIPIVCKAGLDDPKLRAEGKAGTGPYKITEMVQGDHYTAELRTDYTWGPGNWTSTQGGVPSKVTARVVANPTTTANLLLAGQLNHAMVAGPEERRVAAQKLFSVSYQSPAEILFNQAGGRPAADLAVRTAIVQALDLPNIGKVLSATKGEPLRQLFQGATPNFCPGNTVEGNIPRTDVAAAQAALDKAGWVAGPDGVRAKNGKQLSFDLIYLNGPGQPTAAVELIQQQLKAIGVKLTPRLVDGPAAGNAISNDNWDMFLARLTVDTPYAFVPSFSGPSFPEGGQNFGSVRNITYEGLVAKAAKLPGRTGCDTWNEAESALIKNVDIVPFYAVDTPIYGKGATFSTAQFPWSIRMTAS
ncbi:ABC transporter substrate-binding protein [Microtetraspora malaysiensis]|uniref:ABC transporter substrate-binding protein n=1 Tax=Microtetraspora malaysiensis TaxID=161358 RepID=UPI003D9480FF